MENVVFNEWRERLRGENKNKGRRRGTFIKTKGMFTTTTKNTII